MPNTRRRRFSVQNDIAGRNSSKMQNGLQPSHTDNEHTSSKSSKNKNKICPNSSKSSGILDIVTENETASTSSILTVKTCPIVTVDKDVTASSTTISYSNVAVQDIEMEESKDSEAIDITKKKQDRPEAVDKTPVKKEKHPREHRAKVRSPRRRMSLPDPNKSIELRRTVATAPIDWSEEVNVPGDDTATIESSEQHRQSSHSFDDMCRICHGGESLSLELGQLISACSCRGTVGRVHVKCLERWLTESGKSRCELCGTRYITKRVHRYGVPRALMMWILSQNAKQLMVDSLGIMLMSPLAVLAAWLSGRTLAGLMAQETEITPWPLASTFVLACMTLVCYYCWIVSAATRHALGWWIWYRSQYEVRLQLQDSAEEE